ncbi:MAG: hypothetical protein MJ165_01940 [Alphaproteobacteria bacterium]|nr:hypothetical protein [Alphaproteobacteria bacterium]
MKKYYVFICFFAFFVVRNTFANVSNEVDDYVMNKVDVILQNITPEQELYIQKHAHLFNQAAYIYNYLVAREYIIKWCASYHSVNNLRTAFDIYLGPVKYKTESVLIEFIGASGFAELNKIFTQDEKVQQFYNQQQEAEYISSKLVANLKNKEQYCQVWDSEAKDVIKTGYDNLKVDFPDFFD